MKVSISTAICSFRYYGQLMLSEQHLYQDEQGLYLHLSIFPAGQPEEDRESWSLFPEDLAKWADDHPDWFEFLCIGGFHINIDYRLAMLNRNKDRDFFNARDKLFHEFMRLAAEKGHHWAGVTVYSFSRTRVPPPEGIGQSHSICPN
jgi:hypothetical protein